MGNHYYPPTAEGADMYGGHSNPNPNPNPDPNSNPNPGPNPNPDPDPDPRYGGHWARGLPHGHGVYCYAGGASFDGEHAEGVRHGAGRPRLLKLPFHPSHSACCRVNTCHTLRSLAPLTDPC